MYIQLIGKEVLIMFFKYICLLLYYIKLTKYVCVCVRVCVCMCVCACVCGCVCVSSNLENLLTDFSY